MNSRQIALLTGGSQQNLLRRLKRLYNSCYLDRPPIQIDYYRTGGSHPMVYALGNRGADLLQEKYGIPRGKIDWTAKNRSLKRVFLHHTLAVSEFLIRLEASCRKSGEIRFVGREEAQILLGNPIRTQTPFKWNVKTNFNGSPVQIGIIPDYVFGIESLKGNGGIVYYFLEVDRGTMPVVRNNLEQTSLYRKLLAYYETWRQNLHTSLFGLKRFRVIIITSNRERLNHIIAVNKLLNNDKGSGIFLLAGMPDIYSSKDIRELPFVDGQGNEAFPLVKDTGL